MKTPIDAIARTLVRSQSGTNAAKPAEDQTTATCFVVSPIGREGSDVRKHVDDVFYCIIEPAVHAHGFNAVRSDHGARPGRITEQIISSILTDDLIICLLTGANPNVYYELAIAEAAGRPIVLLKLKDEPIPFDVKDIRIIEYDMEPRSVLNGTYARQVYDAISHLKQEGLSKRVVPFRPELNPLGALGERFRLYDRYSDAITDGQRHIEIVKSANRSLRICGLTLFTFQAEPMLRQILTENYQKGCHIRLLLMDENNAALPQMLNDGVEDQVAKVRAQIAESWSAWHELGREFGSGFSVRKVTRGLLYQQLIMNDREMLYTPYAYSLGTFQSPTVRIDSGSVLFTRMREEFDFLWAANEFARPAATLNAVSKSGRTRTGKRAVSHRLPRR